VTSRRDADLKRTLEHARAFRADPRLGQLSSS
jgi:hypothetical protein